MNLDWCLAMVLKRTNGRFLTTHVYKVAFSSAQCCFPISAHSLEAATEAEVSQFGSYDPSEEKENDNMVDASNVMRVIERLNNKSIEVEFRNKLHSVCV